MYSMVYNGSLPDPCFWGQSWDFPKLKKTRVPPGFNFSACFDLLSKDLQGLFVNPYPNTSKHTMECFCWKYPQIAQIAEHSNIVWCFPIQYRFLTKKIEALPKDFVSCTPPDFRNRLSQCCLSSLVCSQLDGALAEGAWMVSKLSQSVTVAVSCFKSISEVSGRVWNRLRQRPSAPPC